MTTPVPNKIARTGRVQSWLDDPTSRLPVSCTVFVVDDTMEGPNGIEASWRFVSHALRNGAGVAVHLSNIRPKGSDNGKGLVASGPVSFARIYSALNETLRRGGVYKNGAVVLHLDITHPDILEFINTPRSELPWVKRCVDLIPIQWYNAPAEVKAAILHGIASGDIWLNKIKSDRYGRRIYGNVCLEIYLPNRGTCLLQHVNLGACTIDEIPAAFESAMTELVLLHGRTRVEDSGEYLDPEIDRQVGLGMLGLANLLAIEGVSYTELGDAFDRLFDNETHPVSSKADEIVFALCEGIGAAAQIAYNHGMQRAFAIAPTASCSYKNVDRLGFTTAPEIAPPISRTVDRDSGTFGVQSFDYGNVSTAEEVGYYHFRRVADGIVELLYNTGLFHGYSLNSWSDQVIYNEYFIEEWLDSPQTSLYYALPTISDSQDKSNILAGLGDDAYDSLFAPLDIPQVGTEQIESLGSVWDAPQVCGLTPDTCTSCSE